MDEPPPVFVGRAARDPGAWNQKGVVVLRRDWVAFIPTEGRTHIAAIAAKAAMAGVGVLQVSIGGTSVDSAHLLDHLRSLSPEELERVVPEAVRATDGVVYRPDQARYFREDLPLGIRLSFVTEGDRVMVLNAKQVVRSAVFEALVSAWPAVPQKPKSKVLPILMILAGLVCGLVALAGYTLALLMGFDGIVQSAVTLACTSTALCALPGVALIAFAIRSLRRNAVG